MDLRAWLSGLGLDAYAEIFRLNSIDIDSIHTLTPQDLRDLGMVSVGHRRLFLDAAKALRLAPSPRKERSFLWQRRHMTILFFDLVDFTERSHQTDPELLQDSLAAFYDVAESKVGTYGGRVLKRLGDGLLVGFGWPIAHEDDALRACLCALAIRTALIADGDWSVRIGGATGFVFVGGDPADAIGEVVNLSSRLQAAAEPGQILVTEDTLALAGSTLKASSVGTLALKGFAKPVAAFALEETSTVHALEPADGPEQLIGRVQEMAWLNEHWSAARGGLGRVVLVEGQAGIGKTALSRHIAKTARQDGGRVVWSLSYEWLSGSPLEPILSFANLLRGGEEVANVLQPAQRLENPRERRDAMFAALRALLFNPYAADPQLFILDDAQWADSSTIDFLRLSLPALHQAPCLIILNVRSDEVTPRPNWWPDFDAVLTVEPLPDPEADLLLDLLDSLPKSDRFARRDLISRCGGVPLFLRELGQYLSTHGPSDDAKGDSPSALESRAGRSEDQGSTTLPTKLVDLMTARIDSLAPAQKELALAASCIGMEFALDTLAVAADVPSAQAAAEAEGMIRARIIQVGQSGFRFDHPLLCEAAYGLVSRAERQKLHARIFDTLDPASTRPELLARHALGANRLDDALRWSTEAGRQSLASAALREAVTNFRRALSCIQLQPDQTPGRRAEEAALYQKLAHALNGIYGSGAPETTQAFRRSMSLAEEIDDGSLFFPAAYGVSVTAFVRAEMSESQAAAELMARRAGSGTDVNHRYMALNIRATTEMFAGNFAAAAETFVKVAELEPELRLRDLVWSYGHDPRGAMRSHWALALMGLDDPQGALAHWQTGLDMVSEGTHRQSTAQPMLFGAMMHIALNRSDAAKDLVGRALTLSEKLALTMWERVAHCLDAFLSLGGTGSDASSARTQMRTARTTLESMGVLYILPLLLRLEAQLAEAIPEPEVAHALRREAETLEKRTGCRWAECWGRQFQLW
ncbi:MAG TPA: AAA family ATPase [Tabrizicola sp.]